MKLSISRPQLTGGLTAILTGLAASQSEGSGECHNRARVIPEGTSATILSRQERLLDIGYEIDTKAAERALCDMGVVDAIIDIGGVNRDPATLTDELRTGAVAGIIEPPLYNGRDWFFHLDCHRAVPYGDASDYTIMANGERYPKRASCNLAASYEIGDIRLRILGQPSCRQANKPDSITALSDDCARAVNRLENEVARGLNIRYRFIRR